MYWALGLGNQLIQIDPGSSTVVVRLGAADAEPVVPVVRARSRRARSPPPCAGAGSRGNGQLLERSSETAAPSSRRVPRRSGTRATTGRSGWGTARLRCATSSGWSRSRPARCSRRRWSERLRRARAWRTSCSTVRGCSRLRMCMRACGCACCHRPEDSVVQRYRARAGRRGRERGRRPAARCGARIR